MTKTHWARRAGRLALVAAIVTGVLAGATGCRAGERLADHRSGADSTSVQEAPSLASEASDDLDEIDALLNGIEADLAEADRDAATLEGDVE